MNKFIFHLDINYFYAQVEEIINSSLKNQPVVVCMNRDDAIILTSNYISRMYDIRAGQKLLEAKKKNPMIVVVQPKMEAYSHYSNLFFETIKKYITKEIEKTSIDECYIDLSHLINNKQEAIRWATDIYKIILKKTNLKISIGIGNTKFHAKTANDISNKRVFYYTLYKDEIMSKLWSQKLSSIYMVGKSTALYFNDKKITTVKDFLSYKNKDMLQKDLKSKYHLLVDFFCGKSSDIIEDNEVIKTISYRETFSYGINDVIKLNEIIDSLVEKIYCKLKNESLIPLNLVFYLRHDNNKNLSRSCKFNFNHCTDLKLLQESFKKFFNSFYDYETLYQIGIGCHVIKKEKTKKQNGLII